MVKVAINITPLKTAHKNRGIGYYTDNLLDYLKKNGAISVQTFTHISEVKDVDIVHYPWFDFYFHTLPIIKIAPTVVTIHDVIPLIFKEHYPVGLKGKANFFLQKLALKNCKTFITDSEVSKKDIIKYLKIKEEKIYVIPLATDSEFRVLTENKRLLIKRKYALPDRFVLYTGDANWVKNLPFLIESFRALKNDLNFLDVKLVLVGGVFLKKVDNIDHPELNSLKKVNELISELDLEKEVIRLGQIDTKSLAGIYNLATVYVQPSLYEGFGLPILEAMSCGTPVICSKGGSLPEVGGDATIYFDPNNVKQLAVLLREVLMDKSLQSKLSKLGLVQADKYSWEKTAAESIKVYCEATNFSHPSQSV